ncbi:Insertion element IS6110 uncharacterized 12.0 kDa protein [Escherichia coli]|nr:Insertion element IS6110 uncharacterized 12.0 kDa protein [Escherichia coli]
MTKNTRFSPEVRQRAVRMVLESQGEYDSQWATICSIAPKIGCTPETLRVWVRQHERNTGGGDGGLTTAERQRLKSWNVKIVNCAAVTISFELPLILRRRSSTASGKVMPLLDKLRKLYGSDRYAVNYILPRQLLDVN